MGIESKRIGNLPQMAEMTEETNIVVEDGGKAKRIPAGKAIPKPLPDNYLPATVPVIKTAKVGQIVAVKAVDEKGKPTEWEAVDSTSISGKTIVESELRCIASSAFVSEIFADDETFKSITLSMRTMGEDGYRTSERLALIDGESYTIRIGDDVYTTQAMRYDPSTPVMLQVLPENGKIGFMAFDYKIGTLRLFFMGANFTTGEVLPYEVSIAGKYEYIGVVPTDSIRIDIYEGKFGGATINGLEELLSGGILAYCVDDLDDIQSADIKVCDCTAPYNDVSLFTVCRFYTWDLHGLVEQAYCKVLGERGGSPYVFEVHFIDSGVM